MFAAAIKPLVLSAVSVVMSETRAQLALANKEEAVALSEQVGLWTSMWDNLGKGFHYPSFFAKADVQEVWDYIISNEDFLSMFMSASAQFFFRLTRVDENDKMPSILNHLRDDLCDALTAFYPTSTVKTDAEFRIETGFEQRHLNGQQWRSVMTSNPWMLFVVAIYLAGIEAAEWAHISTTAAYTGDLIEE